jgi:hypothetical protein
MGEHVKQTRLVVERSVSLPRRGLVVSYTAEMLIVDAMRSLR